MRRVGGSHLRLPVHRLAAPLAFGIVPALLFGSIMMGARLPGSGLPRALEPAPLDYSRGPLDGLAPLRPGFISDVLGGLIPAPGGQGILGSGSPVGTVPSGPLDVPPVVITHALTNDDLADAYRVSSVPFTARTNTSQASRESGEPSECAPVGSRTVWYRFRAPTDIGLIADTFGTDHAVSLGVFTGRGMRRLQREGECSTHARGNAHVPFPALKGSTYYFQISSISGGDLVFSVRLQGLTTPFPYREDEVAPPQSYPSRDGRYISFSAASPQSDPSNRCVGFLVFAPPAPGTICRVHSYVHDTVTERTMMVSVSSDGEPGDDVTFVGHMSADGRYVLLWSWATNLVDDDTNQCTRLSLMPGSCIDVFVHDRDADGNGIFDETFPGGRKTVRVSVASDGTQGNGHSVLGWLSPDGRYVAFQSWASNLVDDDTNGVGDTFVHDRDADGNGIFDETFPRGRRTWRVSVSSSGSQAEIDPSRVADPEAVVGRRDYVPFEVGNHYHGSSANGRYVMFRSPATNLDPRCTNGAYHVYLHDIPTQTTQCVSLNSQGRQGNRGTRLHNLFTPKISDNGRFAIFNSDATDLVPDDTNDEEDLFLRDLLRGTTERVTVGWDGEQAVGENASLSDVLVGSFFTAAAAAVFEDIYTSSQLHHTITSDGRFVIFTSGASNLVPGDDNGARDVFIRDLHRGTTTLVSVSTSGRHGDGASSGGVSWDGRLVTFFSLSENFAEESQPYAGLFQGMYIREMPEGP